jgi:ABC-type glycerol-3-phosphate transport system permease component
MFALVTLPLVRSAIAVAMTNATVNAFNLFDEAWVLAGSSLETRPILVQIYLETFQNLRFSYGMALSVVITFVSLLVSLVYVLRSIATHGSTDETHPSLSPSDMDRRRRAADLVARSDLLDDRQFRDADGRLLGQADPLLPAALHASTTIPACSASTRPHRRRGSMAAVSRGAAEQRRHVGQRQRCCAWRSPLWAPMPSPACAFPAATRSSASSSQRWRSPPMPCLIPLYQIMIKMHLVDTYVGVALIYVSALPAAFALAAAQRLRSTAAGTGGGRTARWRGTSLHLLQHRAAARRPGLTAAAILTFLGAWGQYLVPLIFSPQATKPLTVLIPEFVTKNFIDYGLITASGSIAIVIPPSSSSFSTDTSSADCWPARSSNRSHMNTTEKVIREQFPYWEKALGSNAATTREELLVYRRLRYVLLSCHVAGSLREHVPGAGNRRTRCRVAQPPVILLAGVEKHHVVAISRSGETTETVAAAKEGPRERRLRHSDHR